MSLHKSVIAGIATAGMLFVSTSAFARPPAELADLEGVRASAGESAMVARGYKTSGSKTEGGQKWTFWHNKNALNPCVGVITRDGRYETIQGFDNSNCSHSDAAGAAVAGAVVAGILGAALLGHHEHHHQDGKHHADQTREAEYERGYNDGVYNGSFVNYDHNQDYVDGFAAGQRERESRMSASRYHYHEHKRNKGSSAIARQNCAVEAARYWNMPVGSAYATNAVATGNGMYDVTVTAGYRAGICTATANGDVKFIQNR